MKIKAVEWPAFSEWRQVLTRTWKESGDDNVGLLAAGVAFYLFLAFVPLLASVVLTYGLVADPQTVSEHIQTLARTLPREAASIIADQLQAITGDQSAGKGLGLLLAIGLALYGASKGAAAIVTALNVAYEVKETRGFIARTFLSIAITVGMVAMLLVATLAISAVGFIETLLPFSSPVVHVLLQGLALLGAGAIVSAGIALVYRYGPNRPDAPWRWITPGSAVATLLWVLASLGFSFYVSKFGNYNATYGALGGVVVFLTWLYLTGYILLMGGELNSELERQQAAKDPAAAAVAGPQPGKEVAAAPTPARHASPVRHASVAEATVAAPRATKKPERRSRLAPAALLVGGAAVGALLRGRRHPRTDIQLFHYPSEGGAVRQ
ncbi:YihY/virulence factor BrkB family protein [Sphingomonas parva]|uniref:YihY/virulence factor BrkB family protein n=1 Tax=Sphingomonas parva TaxID=2555898 RepID=A0A4Y8ZVF3_9SPHN|nr:YihY/virulence factor BrkB family protein [Sphingomonas parva]TFI59990.1 YihY/virulence factor BrkB family protein [Sphingomonas parva]